MESVSVVEAREQFSDLMAKVAYGGQRIIVERRGRPMVAWISIEDLRRMDEMARAAAHLKDERYQALDQAAAVRQQIEVERAGAPLPDAAELITQLREESVDEISGMR